MRVNLQTFVRFVIASATVCLLISCGLVPRSTGVMPLGPDTWRVAARSSGGNSTDSQKMAMDEALTYCKGLGKQLLVIGTKREQYGGPFEVSFRCLQSGDPELQRPVLERSPDAVIKVQ
jgi:hypothetical protein